MILALDVDSVLHVFTSEEQACSCIEAIDIENCEYAFCDHTGRRYIAMITDPVGKFRSGAFKLVAGDFDPALPMAFVNQAREIGQAVRGISSLDELRNFLSIS